jgi:hypothetical protein
MYLEMLLDILISKIELAYHKRILKKDLKVLELESLSKIENKSLHI